MNDRHEARERDLVARIQQLFHPGPLDWLLGLTPEHTRFHAGAHLHGLDDRNDRVRAEPRAR